MAVDPVDLSNVCLLEPGRVCSVVVVVGSSGLRVASVALVTDGPDVIDTWPRRPSSCTLNTRRIVVLSYLPQGQVQGNGSGTLLIQLRPSVDQDQVTCVVPRLGVWFCSFVVFFSQLLGHLCHGDKCAEHGLGKEEWFHQP